MADDIVDFFCYLFKKSMNRIAILQSLTIAALYSIYLVAVLKDPMVMLLLAFIAILPLSILFVIFLVMQPIIFYAALCSGDVQQKDYYIQIFPFVLLLVAFLVPIEGV